MFSLTLPLRVLRLGSFRDHHAISTASVAENAMVPDTISDVATAPGYARLTPGEESRILRDDSVLMHHVVALLYEESSLNIDRTLAANLIRQISPQQLPLILPHISRCNGSLFPPESLAALYALRRISVDPVPSLLQQVHNPRVALDIRRGAIIALAEVFADNSFEWKVATPGIRSRVETGFGLRVTVSEHHRNDVIAALFAAAVSPRLPQELRLEALTSVEQLAPEQALPLMGRLFLESHFYRQLSEGKLVADGDVRRAVEQPRNQAVLVSFRALLTRSRAAFATYQMPGEASSVVMPPQGEVDRQLLALYNLNPEGFSALADVALAQGGMNWRI